MVFKYSRLRQNTAKQAGLIIDHIFLSSINSISKQLTAGATFKMFKIDYITRPPNIHVVFQCFMFYVVYIYLNVVCLNLYIYNLTGMLIVNAAVECIVLRYSMPDAPTYTFWHDKNTIFIVGLLTYMPMSNVRPGDWLARYSNTAWIYAFLFPKKPKTGQHLLW